MKLINQKYNLSSVLNNKFLEISEFNIKKNTSETIMTKENIILVNLLFGEKTIKIGKNKILLNENQLLLLPDFVKLKTKVEEDTSFVLIKFNKQVLKTIISEISQTNNYPIYNIKNFLLLDSPSEILHKSYMKIKDYFLQSENTNSIANLYSLEFIGNLLNEKYVKELLEKHFEPEVETSINIMRTNIYSNITISDIAKKVNLTTANYSLKFKNIMGYSPSEYFRLLKIKESLLLLEFKSINEIAKDLNYSTSYFIKLFKLTFGITPKQYILSSQS